MNEFIFIPEEGGGPLDGVFKCSKCGALVERGIVNISSHAWNCWKTVYDVDMSPKGITESWSRIVEWAKDDKKDPIWFKKFDPIELKKLSNPE